MKISKIIPALLCLFSLMLVPNISCAKDNDALLELLKALHENGTIDAATYQLVSKVAAQEATEEQQTIKRTVREESKRSAEEVVKAEIKKTPEKSVLSKNTVKIGGRIMVDAATYSEDINRHNDGTEIRRARLFAKGNLGEAWGYKLQYDFTASGLSGIQDAYLDYKGSDNFKVRLGHFKEPFSLQNITSSKYVLFTERGLPYVFTEGRNVGLQLSTAGKNWSAFGGVFGDGRDGAGSDNDEGMGFSGRFIFNPYKTDNSVVHLGLSASHRETGSVDTLRFRERPESHLTDTRLVDTGTFDAESYSRFVAEAAFVHGPFHAQGEYYHTNVEREIAGNPDLDFSGFYVEGSWMLTGESMNYKKSGSFSRLSPDRAVGKGGIGAWQVALRYSDLDLSDGDVFGGEINNFTLGLNWYATEYIRFSANYVNVLEVDGGPASGDEPEAVNVRAQLEF